MSRAQRSRCADGQDHPRQPPPQLYCPEPRATEDWALKQLDLEWSDGGAYALLGPSGCGKTTLLNIISGLVRPTEGRVLFDGVDLTDVPTDQRHIAQVFQFPVVYDTMTVYDNLAFPLAQPRRARGRGQDQRCTRSPRMLDLEGMLRKRASGLTADGKQKISLGRGLVRSDVNVIMFDEPLTVIDPHLKWQLRSKLKELHQRIGRTMIYVTHDQTEALTFADKVVVMHEGKVVQIGSPVELFERPHHTFVGHFIGSPGMNVLPCEVEDGSAHVRGPARAGREPAGEAARRPAPRDRRAPGVRGACAGRHPGRHRQGQRCRPLPHRRGAARRQPHQAARRGGRRRAGRRAPMSGSIRPTPGSTPTAGWWSEAAMRQDENQKGWLFVLPVVVLVAFNAVIPLMAVVNYSVQETFGNNLFFFEGVKWFEEVLHSERFHAALLRQLVFTGIILLIEVPLGVAIALAMPRRGPWVSVCLVLMALPLLIPWNVVGAMWNIFALPDIGMLGRMINSLGFNYNYTQQPLSRLGDADRHGRVALDVAGRPARLCRPQRHSRRLLPGGQDRRRLRRGRCSATSSCPR